MEQQYKLIAVTGVMTPNKRIGKDEKGKVLYRPGRMIKPGQEIPHEDMTEEHLEMLLDGGHARFAGADPIARYNEPTKVLVGQRGHGDNAVDLEAGLIGSGRDGEILGRLDEIEADQEDAGIDAAEAQREMQRQVEVNLGTGEQSDTDDDDPTNDDEDMADTQVS